MCLSHRWAPFAASTSPAVRVLMTFEVPPMSTSRDQQNTLCIWGQFTSPRVVVAWSRLRSRKPSMQTEVVGILSQSPRRAIPRCCWLCARLGAMAMCSYLRRRLIAFFLLELVRLAQTIHPPPPIILEIVLARSVSARTMASLS